MENEREPVTVTDDEAEQLYRYMRNAYLDPNKFGALRRLLDRVYVRLEIGEKILAETK